MTAALVISAVCNVVLLLLLFYRRQTRTWIGAMSEPPPPADPGLVFHRPQFRRFVFNRKIDVTGISGTGVRVEGVVFSDGWGVSHWLDLPPMCQPKTEVWHKPGIDPLVQISGHNGASEVVWLD